MTFSELVKYTRKQLSISQEQLARDINVSFSTINRWENEKTKPNQLAKKMFIEYCKAKKINVDEIDS
jgi:DNA-binding transcriptional regulator YiaG